MTRTEIALHSLYALATLALAVVTVPVVAAFARWDSKESTFTGGADQPQWPTIRGDLPSWAWPWETFDERLPGGVYEETIRDTLKRFGPYVCSVRWLLRNRFMGLSRKLFGEPVKGRKFEIRTFGPIGFGYGWKTYRDGPLADVTAGPFIEIPSVTLRLKRNLV